jgi:hypothetical protein
MSGLVLSEPVLQQEFPNGPPPIEDYLFKRFRNQYERFMLSKGTAQQRNQSQWINFILGEFLDIYEWKRSDALPESAIVALENFNQILRPSRVIQQNGELTFMVMVVNVNQHLDRVDRTPGRWKASPATKLDKLLRETNTQLGLLTNGLDWRLMYSEPGLNTTYITWTTQGWQDERATLNAFRSLLERDRLIAGADKTSLKQLIKASQERQVEIADQLGIQVREAIEIFVHALDRLDKAQDNVLLKDMSQEQIYEMSIVVMMRIVFLLYAEENGLLPHGEVIYDQGYGVNHLAFSLQQTALNNPDLLENQWDGWQSLLATFRLVYGGCNYSELNLRAYGGSLFDPRRFPVLEDPRLALSNATIQRILHKLTHARTKVGREILNQRVSYNTLDVEQIGYMYEGLLDHTVLQADDLVVKLISKNDVKLPVRELELRQTGNFVRWLKQVTDRSVSSIKKALTSTPEDETIIRLRNLVGEEHFKRLLPLRTCWI